MNLKSSYLQFSKEKYALDGATSLQNERKNRNAETEEREKKRTKIHVMMVLIRYSC